MPPRPPPASAPVVSGNLFLLFTFQDKATNSKDHFFYFYVLLFTYLDRTYSRSANIDAEVGNRIAKASSTFGRLKKSVWEQRGISQCTTIKVYRAVVLTTLLYGCETWTIYRKHNKLLQQFHLQCLHDILNISWQDKIHPEVLERAVRFHHP